MKSNRRHKAILRLVADHRSFAWLPGILAGLGPDEVMFKAWPDDRSQRRGLWMEHVRRWKKAAHSADAVPPGVRDGEPMRGRAGAMMDYYPRNDNYQLRPEVCLDSPFSNLDCPGRSN